MTGLTRANPAVAPPRVPEEQFRHPDSHDAGVLGQAISNRLFSAGLDLDFALTLTGNGPARMRMEHAVTQLDEAIKELRHLMIAVIEQAPVIGQTPRLEDDVPRQRHP